MKWWVGTTPATQWCVCLCWGGSDDNHEHDNDDDEDNDNDDDVVDNADCVQQNVLLAANPGPASNIGPFFHSGFFCLQIFHPLGLFCLKFLHFQIFFLSFTTLCPKILCFQYLHELDVGAYILIWMLAENCIHLRHCQWGNSLSLFSLPASPLHTPLPPSPGPFPVRGASVQSQQN